MNFKQACKIVLTSPTYWLSLILLIIINTNFPIWLGCITAILHGYIVPTYILETYIGKK